LGSPLRPNLQVLDLRGGNLTQESVEKAAKNCPGTLVIGSTVHGAPFIVFISTGQSCVGGLGFEGNPNVIAEYLDGVPNFRAFKNGTVVPVDVRKRLRNLCRSRSTSLEKGVWVVDDVDYIPGETFAWN
jgi:hypothetical protein